MGKNSDAGIFDRSLFGQKFKDGLLNLPLPCAIEDNGPAVPFLCR
jgi:hypothetical protein